VHIGDVHYPDAIQKGPQVDKKDEGFNSGFIEKLAPNTFMEVGSSLTRCLETQDIDGVLFSGDLTSFGNLKSYQECVQYFDRMITSAESVIGRNFAVEVVPGNHDLKRKGLTSGGLEERFDDFKEAWISVGRDIFPVGSIKKDQIDRDNASLKIISLNTCLGCGEEYKKFPSEIASIYKKLIDAADLEDKDQFNKFCDRIDTPAIYQDHLREIEIEVSGIDDNSLCLILGHHALLPQPTVRVALYTEIINGGNARMALTTLNSPIIYCHGHIHDDPIEILTRPENPESSLVLISAPEYSKGFNVIEILYTDNGYPVGIVITPHRAETWGRVREKAPIRIPIRQPEDMINFCDDRTESVYRLLGGEPSRFDKLLARMKSEKLSFSEMEFENILNELEWLQVINISNKSKSSRGWIIGRVGL